MTEQDPQEVWEDYYRRKKEQRINEAIALRQQMEIAGVSEETFMALDFLLFGNNEEDVRSLSSQLSENYNTDIESTEEENYWHVKGTTRPEGITLTKEQHLAWVEFMSDVAQSYACVLSNWSFEVPSLKMSFRSDEIESAS
jgi:hypothetical protein